MGRWNPWFSNVCSKIRPAQAGGRTPTCQELEVLDLSTQCRKPTISHGQEPKFKIIYTIVCGEAIGP